MALFESRVRTQRRGRLLRGAALAGAAVLLVVCLLVGLAWLPALQLREVTVSGVPSGESSLIAAYANSMLSGTYLLLLPRHNFLLAPTRAITAGILSTFNEVASAQAYTQGRHILAISVSMREPVALWCGNTVASSSPCFLLDGNGVAYAALTISGGSFNRYFGALEDSSTPQAYLTPGAFQSLTALAGALSQNIGESIESVYVDPDEDVHVAFQNGFTLIFALSDVNVAYQRFELALQSDPFKAHPLSAFSYLDMRFGDKLYYKLQATSTGQ